MPNVEGGAYAAAPAIDGVPVDATMIDTGDPSTWHGWIHGLAFLVVLAGNPGRSGRHRARGAR